MRHAVELLPQPVVRDDRAVPLHLRLPEDEGQNRDVEVARDDAEQMVPSPVVAKDLGEELARVELPPFGMQGEERVDPPRVDRAGDSELLGERVDQCVDELRRRVADAHEADRLHDSRLLRLQP